jgi:CRP-like cAMP-binding protein
MPNGDEIVSSLRGLALFHGLGQAELEQIADPEWERRFPAGERVLRRGLSGSGFYVILDGEVAVRIDERELSRLRRGDFFGEVSTLLGAAPTADIVAESPMHCLEVPGPDLERFLLAHPRVMLEVLKTEARRLQDALAWRG